jgi:flavin-dependent dehydrogenase
MEDAQSTAVAQYDLIVVGGGPAGSACAITAARTGARVLLLEKDTFPRHKVCGEFVSSESLRLLESLVAGSGSEGLDFDSRPEIASARILVGDTSVEFPIAPPAKSIPRFELDEALCRSGRRCGVRVEEDVTVHAVNQNGLFTVQSSSNEFTARAVVNATGRWSQLTRYQTAGKVKWIGLKAHFREAAPRASVDLYFFNGGYCGVQPVRGDTVNACAMVQPGVARSLEEVFAAHPRLWRRSREWEICFPAITTSPLYFRKPETCAQGMILAGDSAGFIDPFAGDGISLALHSGALAGECLAGFLQGRFSWDDTHRRYRTAYLRRLAPAFRSARALRMLLSAPSWLSSRLVSLAATKPVSRLIVRATRAKESP